MGPLTSSMVRVHSGSMSVGNWLIRIATAPSRTPAGLRASSRYASIAREQRRPVAAAGSHESYSSSIPAPPTQRSFTPPTSSPLPDSRSAAEQPSPDPARAPRSNHPLHGARHTTSLPRLSSGRGSIQSASLPSRGGERCLHHFVGHRPRGGHRPGRGFTGDDVSLRPRNCTMIAAPVQCDVDGIPKGRITCS